MYNTGNPIPSAALEDMADNAQTFDALVTKTEGTATDRKGITRRVFQQILMDMGFQPLSGSFQTGATITARNQTLYDEVSHVFYAWGGALPKVVTVGSTPAATGGTGVGAWVDRTDVVLRKQLPYVIYSATGIADASGVLAASIAAGAANKMLAIHGIANIESAITIDAPIFDTKQQIFTSTSAVTITSGYTRPEWFGDDEGSVDKAVRALPNPAGGIVKLESRAYKRNGYLYNSGSYMDRPNIKIIGSKMPRVAFDAKSLVDGSVIQGPFLAFADNFQCENVGFDSGKDYIDTYCGGVGGPIIGEGLILTYPTDASKAASDLRRGARLSNVIGLCESPTSATHAIIAGEGYTDVSCDGDIIGVYGVHGVVFKCDHVTADTVKAYANASEGLIIKSDQQATAKANNISISKAILSAGLPIGVSSAAATAIGIAQSGVQFMCVDSNSMNNVNINFLSASGQKHPIEYVFTGPAIMRSVYVDKAILDCIGSASGNSGVFCNQNLAGGEFLNSGVGDLEVRNTEVGLQLQLTSAGGRNLFKSNHLSAINCRNAIDISNSSRVNIDTVSAENCTSGVVNISDYAKPRIGTINKDSASGPDITGLVPALSANWASVVGGPAFSLSLSSWGVVFNGLIMPTSTNQAVATLPVWARPVSTKRFTVNGSNGNTISAVSVTIDTSGVITVNEVGGGVANCSSWLSLDGVSYEIK